MSAIAIDEIMKVLPHRYPMLLVDKIVECDDKTRIVGIKNVTVNEPFFMGHFPGAPVMPGVLQLEAMAQTAGVLLNRIAGASGNIPYFMAIDKARFRRVVRPGDQMRIEVEILNLRTKACKFGAKVLVDGNLASEAEMMCMITDQKASA
ncbi:MAG: 3-hydroxyacyl-[acyl-carrier-protein] dehydratase FabZ [Verrucomicrobia bacterium]|nr:3-hydroxyacyl-[acyl-carrier-protein] dehydratase FabZ [Verrucomicrobiota bacterium]